MSEAERDDGYFEIQLDRGTVALAGLGVVALLVLAFLLGSWWGRSEAGPGEPPRSAGDPQSSASDPQSSAGDPPSRAGELPSGAGSPATAGAEATAARQGDEDVDGEPLFGDTTVSARGAPPVAPVPAAPVPEAKPPGPSARTTSTPPAGRAVPSRPPAAAPAAAGTASASGWIVQVGALKERREADELSRRLAAKGYPVRIQEEGGFHKVQVGPYEARAEAEGAERRLKAEEKLATWLHRG